MARPTPPPRELTYVPLARIGEDTTFRLRHNGDISSLACAIERAREEISPGWRNRKVVSSLIRASGT